MRIIKCDICKKTIKNDQEIVHVGVGFSDMEICLNCGDVVVRFMKKNKVIDENNKRIR